MFSGAKRNQIYPTKLAKISFLHHSITTEVKNGMTIFTENCPVKKALASGLPIPKFDTVETNPCLIWDYPEIVKPQSPVFKVVSDCGDKLLSELENTTVPVDASTAAVTTPASTTSETATSASREPTLTPSYTLMTPVTFSLPYRKFRDRRKFELLKIAITVQCVHNRQNE